MFWFYAMCKVFIAIPIASWQSLVLRSGGEDYVEERESEDRRRKEETEEKGGGEVKKRQTEPSI